MIPTAFYPTCVHILLPVLVVKTAEDDGLNVAGRKSGSRRGSSKGNRAGNPECLSSSLARGYTYYMNLNGGKEPGGWAVVLHDGLIFKEAGDYLIERGKR